MKKHHAWILYTLLGGCGAAVAANSAAVKNPASRVVSRENERWEAAGRTENETRWRSVSWHTNPVTLEAISTVRSFVELGAGLNVKTANGVFVAANPSFSITATGAEAMNAAHQVIVPGDIGSGEGVTIITPTGENLTFQPFAINYFDPVDGHSVLLGSITNATGWLIASNEIVFSNCFTYLKASIRLRNMRSGIESDLILHEQPPTPESLGLSPQTRLEMLTEQLRGGNPKERRHLLRVEKDAARRVSMLEPDLTDTELKFDGMTMMPGKAFGVPKAQGAGLDSLSSRVGKSFLTIGERRILVEAVEHERIKPLLRRLPVSTTRRSVRAGGVQAEPHARLTAVPRQLPQYPASAKFDQPGRPKASRSIQQVQTARPSEGEKLLAQTAAPAFVLDYQLVNASTLTDYTFQNDTTYHVADAVSMAGTTTLEGGTVLKYTVGGYLGFSDQAQVIDCKTDLYRPAVFTCYDDNTVGEILPGSTGIASQLYNGALYFIGGDRVLENTRFSHIYLPIMFEGGYGGSVTLRNIQVIDAGYFIDAGTAPISIYNGLFYDCGSIFYGGNSSFVGEHLTVHNATVLGAGSTNATVKNSLLVAIANPPTDMGPYTEIATTNLSSASGVFQTVGAGAHYLAEPSPYRDAGTTNINSTLRKSLSKRTTYPPEIIAPVGFNVGNQTWFPRTGRDTDTPDLGYHYDPLDYAISHIFLTNATIQIDPGTAIGVFNRSNTWWYGIGLGEDSHLIASGSADSKITLTHYATVQEIANTNWNGLVHSYVAMQWGGTPEFRCAFTDFTVLGGDISLLDGGTGPWHMTDCQFHGGNLFNYSSGYMFITNSLFNRNTSEFFLSGSNQFRNCSFNGGELLLFSDTALMTDCLFAGTTDSWDFGFLSDSVSSNIAYTTTSPYRIFNTNLNDVILSPVTFQGGPLGYFYVPTNSGLANVGGRNATNAGLYHYTMLTNNLKETNTVVDIGFHYVATDVYGTPLDHDSDGVPDYWEDSNGNGSLDVGIGETDWQTYNSPNGLSGSPSLKVFTPLKN